VGFEKLEKATSRPEKYTGSIIVAMEIVANFAGHPNASSFLFFQESQQDGGF
jgi:hypothetical protein